MHVPDHFLDPGTSVATALVATVAAGALVYRMKSRGMPPVRPDVFVGTTAAIFGLQMVNYPVAAGTSGHLIGAMLAVALLGPMWAMISVALVLLVQCFAFADGGVTALGTNITLMSIAAVLAGWALSQAVLRSRNNDEPATPLRIAGAVALGSLGSVIAAASLFVVMYGIGGTQPVVIGELAVSMLSTHALIGLGEAAITTAVVLAIWAVAPQTLAIHSSASASVTDDRGRVGAGILGGIAIISAGLLSFIASSAPDGLEATAETVGFAGAARDHLFAGLPLADYGAGIDVAVGLVGLVGVGLTVAVSLAALMLTRVGNKPGLTGAPAQS